jgi:signal transduction histidine kinase
MIRFLRQFKFLRQSGVKGQENDFLSRLRVLQEIFQNVPVGIFVLDAEFRFLHINSYMVNFFDPSLTVFVEEVGDQSSFQCPAYLKDVCRPVFERGQNVMNVELQRSVETAPNQLKNWLLNCNPLIDENGQVTKVFGSVTEFTARKNIEAELKAKLEEREEFISIVSHELRTPLTSLDLRIHVLNLDLQKEGVPDLDKVRKSVEKIIKSSRAMVRWVDVLFDLTRIKNGKLNLKKQDVNLNEKVSEVVSSLLQEAERVGSSVVIKGALETPIIGCWDPFRIEQIISNLLSNAIKYGKGKPIEISFGLADVESVRISVRDQGIGIPIEHQSQIFQIFKRANDGKIEGLGLGLYIVRQVIEAHAGVIRVVSEPGKGALFTCEMPLRHKG